MATTNDTTRYGDLCRLCASKTNIVLAINIYGNEGAIRQIDKKIETCLPLQIYQTDQLPKMICENCVFKLESFWEFRDRAIRTESLLADVYKQLSINKVPNEQQQIVKMNIVTMDHSELIMVEPHLLNHQHNLQNVNEIDLAPLNHRDSNIIVGQEIILSHQDINSHNLDDINLNHQQQHHHHHQHHHHDITNQDLSNPGLQSTNATTMLVDAHTLANVRYTENLELIREEQHMFNEDFRLQQQIEISDNRLIENETSNINENILSSKEGDNVKLENQISPQTALQTSSEILLNNKDSNYEPKTSDETNVEIEKTEKDWIYCSICCNTFSNKEFEIHYDQHLNIFKCDECMQVFSDENSLNSHIKQVHDTKIQEYKISTENGENGKLNEDSESEEIQESNGVDDDEEEEDDPGPEEAVDTGGTKRKKWLPKVCPECGKTYKTNYKLTEHMRKHTGEKPYKCKSCDKAFRSKIGLAQHEAKHTGQYDYSCPTCGKGFQCKSYLMVHQRAHSDEKPYPCTTCGRNFKTKQSLLDHTNRHLGLKPYICDTCGRGFITKGLCRAHQKVHSGTDNRKYTCSVCSKRFVSKSYLQTHYRIHTGEKPFMCEVCGKGFLTRVDLRIHSTMHTGEKSYVCEMCGKAFARRDALRCHRRSHTGERPYSCDQCGQTFTQFSPMAIHKRLHTGERPYVCEVCGKNFVSRSTMMAHSKKHVKHEIR